MDEFCQASLKKGDHYLRTPHLNTALWLPWLFWQRVEEDGMWTMFCPNKVPDLKDSWGIEYMKRYVEYEEEFLNDPEKKVYCIQKPVREVFKFIVDCQRKSGMPYILHGDTANMKSNQKYLGYIPCSNLCTEIIEWSDKDHISSCNLASIRLSAFVRGNSGDLNQDFDFERFGDTARDLTSNLNRVIEYNCPPQKKIETTNNDYRPLGMGILGFADTLYQMNIWFDHPLTRQFNKMVFACMYFNSLIESINEAIKYGAYVGFEKSPMGQGHLQFDLWQQEYQLLKEHNLLGQKPLRQESDDLPLDPSVWHQKPVSLVNGFVIQPTWESLKSALIQFGARNSLTLTLMPTATTSTIMMATETVEAPMSNLFERRLLNGSFPVLNRYLEHDAREIGVWNRSLIELLDGDRGSIKYLDKLVRAHPEEFPNFDQDWTKLKRLQEKYKTMWEYKMKLSMTLSAERGRYIDQSQSLNLYIADPTPSILQAAHRTGHYLGLKTGMYYLHQLSAVEPTQINVSPKIATFLKQLRTQEKQITAPERPIPQEKQITSSKPITSSNSRLLCEDGCGPCSV